MTIRNGCVSSKARWMTWRRMMTRWLTILKSKVRKYFPCLLDQTSLIVWVDQAVEKYSLCADKFANESRISTGKWLCWMSSCPVSTPHMWTDKWLKYHVAVCFWEAVDKITIPFICMPSQCQFWIASTLTGTRIPSPQARCPMTNLIEAIACLSTQLYVYACMYVYVRCKPWEGTECIMRST